MQGKKNATTRSKITLENNIKNATDGFWNSGETEQEESAAQYSLIPYSYAQNQPQNRNRSFYVYARFEFTKTSVHVQA